VGFALYWCEEHVNGGYSKGECEEKGYANGYFEEEDVNDYGDDYVKLRMISRVIAGIWVIKSCSYRIRSEEAKQRVLVVFNCIRRLRH
jgi:hypothetical protein